jgi:ABC-type polysaccharide/polyol phosphate export permease
MMRGALWIGEAPSWQLLAVSYGIAGIAFALGFAAFQKLRRGFADVI